MATVLSVIFSIAYIVLIILACICIYRLTKLDILFKKELMKNSQEISNTLKSSKK